MKSTCLRVLSCLLATLVSCSAWGASGYPVERVSPHKSKYIYCNVYLDYACFGIAAGDQLQMSLSADFTIYSISIGRVATGAIYYGRNPQWRGASNIKDCSKEQSGATCIYRDDSGIVDILYAARQGAPFIHIHLIGVATSGDIVSDFLANFRRCEPSAQSVQCTEDRVFEMVQL